MIGSTYQFLFVLAIFLAFQSIIADDCSSPQETGPCRGYFQKYYYNVNSNQCMRFIYGGCDGNGNNYETKQQCESTCKGKTSGEDNLPEETVDCTSSKDSGPCYAYMERYYFDKSTGKCSLFIYGGCKGNRNNYRSLQACLRACKNNVGEDSKHQSERLPDCSSPPLTGPCRAHFLKYYYNANINECIKFIYGGCQGNGNNYETKQHCESTCKSKTSREDNHPEATVDCTSPKDAGPCYAHMRRYHFDENTGKCKLFIYGGCKGNGNNYSSLQACLRACRDRDFLCLLPSDTGPCRARMPRYYFDSELGICKEFVYGGCSGNGNNFETLQECADYCQM